MKNIIDWHETKTKEAIIYGSNKEDHFKTRVTSMPWQENIDTESYQKLMPSEKAKPIKLRLADPEVGAKKVIEFMVKTGKKIMPPKGVVYPAK